MSGRFVRRLRVVAIGGATARLEPAAAACEGCDTCAGRCHGILSGMSAAGRLHIACDALPGPVRTGDEVLLEVDAGALPRRAAAIYGLPVAGVLAGSVVGATLVAATGPARDLWVAGSAFAGLCAGLALARLIAAPATPPYRFASLPSPRHAEPPCAPTSDS
jgi:positive regulator of sigma E activity